MFFLSRNTRFGQIYYCTAKQHKSKNHKQDEQFWIEIEFEIFLPAVKTSRKFLEKSQSIRIDIEIVRKVTPNSASTSKWKSHLCLKVMFIQRKCMVEIKYCCKEEVTVESITKIFQKLKWSILMPSPYLCSGKNHLICNVTILLPGWIRNNSTNNTNNTNNDNNGQRGKLCFDAISFHLE